MQSLCSSEDAMVILDHMETKYYELQLQLYDIQAEILQCEELLLTAQLDSIRRQMTGTLAIFIIYCTLVYFALDLWLFDRAGSFLLKDSLLCKFSMNLVVD